MNIIHYFFEQPAKSEIPASCRNPFDNNPYPLAISASENLQQWLIESPLISDQLFQKENGKSSWFSFTLVLNPKFTVNRSAVMEAMRKTNIEFRIITGGCFLRHDVIKYFDYETVGKIINAHIVHDRGFFVGNFPRDIRQQIECLWKVLDVAVSSKRNS